ncbi:LysR substrate-binding domain-containing protein [Serratia sp. L9]|uniref:LysR substrate-binding domain-containing protein n=1 Tax=Serratia sp. L9 TaxID=3423946 RepID=UPI003D67FD23
MIIESTAILISLLFTKLTLFLSYLLKCNGCDFSLMICHTDFINVLLRISLDRGREMLIPKLTHLKALQAVIQYGSIRAAAKALKQTQPAVTRSIKALEEILGAPLIVRGTKGIVLTEIGQLFEPRMKLILHELERGVDEIKQAIGDFQGTIAFGSSYLPTFSILPQIIKRAHKKHSDIRISLEVGQFSELLPLLRLGQLEFFIGVVSDDISINGFIKENLVETDFCIVAGNGHPLAKSTSLVELCGANWYLPKAEAGYYSQLKSLLFPAGIGTSGSVLISNSTAVAEQLVIHGDYLSIGPVLMLDEPLFKKSLCRLPINETLPSAHYSLVYRQQTTLTVLARYMAEEIRKEYKIQKINI